MKYLNTFFFTFVLILTAPLNLIAQNITLYDRETHLPISNVIIFNEDETVITISNNKGIANLSSFDTNTSLWLQHPAFELMQLPSNQKNEASIYLTPKIFTLDEFVVSANRTEESTKEIPYFLQTVTPRSIEYKNAATAADILTSSGYVSVQKSQGGGGSPNLRGFEANRVLLVIDGVRMNNAIYRSGHLQNSITIDPAILQSTEILFGPSSVIYGSDALGGVISYRSKDPILASNNKTFVSSETTLQGISSSNSYKTNANLNVGHKKWASLSSFTFSNYGDIEMGQNRPDYIEPADWGKMYHYSKRINGQDSMMVNPNPNTQLLTGYKQYDLLQKFKYEINKNHELLLNAQYSTSSNISRFDQLNDYSDDYLKYSEYYYGPQERIFIAASSEYKKANRLFNQLHTIAAWQKIKESRNSRKFSNDSKLSQNENLGIWSLNIDLAKNLNNNSKLNYGAELLYNDLESTAIYTDITDGTTTAAATRYPNAGTNAQTCALYASYHNKLSPQLNLSIGARMGYYRYLSNFVADAYFEPLTNEVINKNSAPSASLGLVYLNNNGWKVNGLLNTGYRVPNVDDYGKIRAKNDEIMLPNPDLDPEFAYNVELSATKSFNNEMLVVNLTLYHTWIHDVVTRTYENNYGVDSVMYDGDMYCIVTNTNQNQAKIKGISAGVNAQPFHNISLSATVNYTHGEITTTNEPLGHITPIFGKLGATYRNNKYRSELYFNYQGKKKEDDMSPYGEDNEDEGANNTFPAWQTLNWANQMEISQLVLVQVSVENISDRHYKTFASGISSPGRHFIVSVTARF